MSALPDNALPVATAAAPPRRAGWNQVFLILMKREYWEHRLAFLWAPAILGLITLVMATIGTIVATAMAHKAANDGQLHLNGEVVLDRLDLGVIVGSLNPAELGQMAQALDMTFLLVSTMPFLVVPFVVFFYCLGALFDDRKDRSILFWKSLPISDRDTVLSKLVSAVIVIPAIASLIAILTLLAFMALLSLVSVLYGGNPVTLIWQPTHWLWLSGYYLIYPLIYLQSAIPTVGWLLLCSAWAKSKPFLWALLIPLALGVATSMTGLLQVIGLDRHWLWGNVISRMLLGTVPATHRDLAYLQSGSVQAGDLFSIPGIYSNFLEPSMWVGLLAGAVMIVIAIRLRRWREEG